MTKFQNDEIFNNQCEMSEKYCYKVTNMKMTKHKL